MRLSYVVLVCFVLGLCDGQQNTAKTASLLCFRTSSANKFEMRLTVKLNTDPIGAFWAINNTEYAKSPFVISEVTPTCSIPYDSTNNLYTVISTVDMNAGSTAQDTNTCGRMTTTGATTSWTWYFIHVAEPPTGTNPLLIGGMDRVYKATCSMNDLTSDTITHNITVSAPNLEQTVTPKTLDVSLKVQQKNLQTGVYSDITATVASGTTCRLVGTYNRGANFDATRMVNMVYFYNIRVSSQANLSPFYQFIHVNGCANVNGANIGPALFNKGMKGSVSGTVNTLTSGDFQIWKTDNSNTQTFWGYYGRCYADNTALCIDACLANTGVTEPISSRKKRQADEDEEPGVVSVVITVTDGDENTSDKSSDTNTIIIMGSVIGVAILTILAIMVCLIAVSRRKRLEKLEQKNRNLPVVVPAHGYKY